MRIEPDLICEETVRPSPRVTILRFTQLIAGLLLWGLVIALFIRSHLGLGPWGLRLFGAAPPPAVELERSRRSRAA